ncbi:MAG TPA: CxxxxCH/CxxCH domain-containing protein [Desulfuromonadales bacterium]|nr:CxxxxCH/CxxCH domain-containing protein [Desulfuromonadales bacterium]
MKKSTSIALIVLVQALLLTVGAFAAITVSPPHYDEASGLVCATCHTTHLDLGSTGYNNVCQSCHRPGDAAAGAKPITPADAANPFGNHSTTGISKMYQTSHRWDGSAKSDAAGAKPPVQAQMTTSGLLSRTAGQLACVSCHNQHSNANGKFLRMANDQDQMCLDCHRSRNTADQAKGTHPVGVDYQQKAALNPAGFNTPPVNANPANPSSAMKLLNGKVSCSTCHGVHTTDSRSGTVDGSANFANLSSGDGNILRTDLRGKSAGAGSDSSINICTNCHAGKKSHNLKGQDIQCVDCHGAHVEFDQNDPSGSKGINIKLIRRNVKPGASGSGHIFYRYTGSQREYKNADNTGVCQGCHAVPASPSEHSSNDPKVCATCHYHNNSNGSFSGACNSCHGYPPATGNHAFHVSSGASGKSMACEDCHGVKTDTTHNNKSVNWALSGPAAGGLYKGLAVGSTGTPMPSASYGSCSNVSCHANVYGAGTMTTPVWGTTAGCSACHTTPIGSTGPATGSHVKHNNSDCSQCHAGATTSAVVPALNHTDGDIDVTNGYPANVAKHTTASGFGGRTCSTASCHANVYGPGTATTPPWGTAVAACSACHTIPIGATGPATGSHVVHNDSTCTHCHNAGTTATSAPATGHANGSIDATNGYPVTAKHAAGSYTGTCSTAICHGQGAPAWGATSTVPVNGFPYSAAQCGKCHAQEGTVTAGAPFYSTAIPKVTLNTNAKVGAHTAHLASVDRLHPVLSCSDCHGTVTLGDPTHMNGATTFVFSALAKTGNLNPSYNPLTGTCSNVYCHGAAMPSGIVSGSNTTPQWNNPNYLPATLTVAGCGTCHGFPPPSSSHSAVTIPVGFPSATVAIGTTCSCHGNINPTGNSYATIFVDPAVHINGTLDGGTCNACHGYPPVSATFVGAGKQNNWSSARIEDYVGGGGAHTINGHVSKLAKHNDGFAYCSKCHSPNDHKTSPLEFKPSKNIKVTIDQRYRMESTKQARYTSNRLDGTSHIAGNCSNISCHFGATPAWNQSQ